jgi:hypothetical protein
MTYVALPRPAVAAAMLLLAGCAADTTVYYAPPPGLTPDRAVSIIGSKDPKSLIGSSEYHLVWQVDGQRVRDSAYRWREPLLVTAGETHRLSLAYGWGGISGGLDVEFNGAPGTTVIVEGEAVDPDHLAHLWLADARTGAVIGEKHPVALSWFPVSPEPALLSPDTDIISLKAIRTTVPTMPAMH